MTKDRTSEGPGYNNDPAMVAALAKARDQLTHLQKQINQIQQPPSHLGYLIATYPAERQAEVYVLGRPMRVAVSPQVDLASLRCGDRIRVDDSLVLAGIAPARREGSIAVVVEVLGADRVIVDTGSGHENVLQIAHCLRQSKLSIGDELRVDLRAGLAFEKLIRERVEQLLTPRTPNVQYEQIGGLERQIAQLREAVEVPFAHPELFQSYGIRPPRGVLLYGPPGCGKTLLAKAIATALANGKTDGSNAYFLSVKGPELLDKFVGETERHIRAIFARARELARHDRPVVIFFDEMEALFKTRGSGISSDVETSVVPQFLSELDGIESMENVVVIGASNREDMIDPAVLRSGRLDVRIKISRPTREGAAQIAGIYLTEETPRRDNIAPQQLISTLIREIYDRETPLLNAELENGEIMPVRASHLMSGAAVAGIIEKAKKAAINESLVGNGEGLSSSHIQQAVGQELAELSDLAAADSPAQWARTLGLQYGQVKRLHPLR
ncbi:proteasome ATPase [Boudabousia marimammalium]|uniref:Proteasome ATPase n=1 Tax=Boudabousia marimammalium TaxID=156892 RepID=A0A1Q5PR48_9ACTO|nr:proteasome ATPase [Boudabousia marimammalium]OKL50044.1 proteasome ATPase [Boudabousia marimammalium]